MSEINPVRLVSTSGGKDSTASLLVALERHPYDTEAVFADTGNEHEITYEYVQYLEDKLGITIVRLKQDFTSWWWRRRDYVRDVWPTKVNRDGTITAQAVIDRVLAVFEKGPTGNPYLDLCIIKGRFPSRKMQFCTEFLKTEPLTMHSLDLVSRYGAVESWQGVRAEESASRAKLPEREGEGVLTIYRPILRWTVEMVFDQHRKAGVKWNPLYEQGMGRVGCMPCINARKEELFEIAKRFPEHIDRIAEWEDIVQQAGKLGNATFFPAPGENETAIARGNVYARVEWSKTKWGGKELRDEVDAESPMCSSAYGLCE